MNRVRKDLRLYLAVMLGVPSVYAIVNSVLAYRGHFSYGFAFLLSFGTFGILFALDAIAALAVRYLVPTRLLDPSLAIYRVGQREHRFYRKIRLGIWQRYIPEMGELAHFKKDRLTGNSPAYLKQFLTETVYAEVMHVWSVLFSVLPMLLFGFDYLYCTLPICVINALLQIPPVMIQRYNRPMLMRLYERKCRETAAKEQNAPAERKKEKEYAP